ncbi:uncharacterized protein LOC125446341 [Stegostoma tigrinum]|uniref:uncharacterized protein LOC125446341 n=1 Tax=Stegostoma tigrinum TaxID=3053191 RepID=UPI0028700DBF|nr:uncharacterized protein LOC125446341 [Stegostoma tigrinum]
MDDCLPLLACKSPAGLLQLKRQQLQKLCKKLGLKASGKNVDLISRLSEHIKEPIGDEPVSHSPLPLVVKEEVSSPYEEESEYHYEAAACYQLGEQSKIKSECSLLQEGDSAWCVVHGMEIDAPGQIWCPLILKSGQILVAAGDVLVPFYLTPAAVETPAHLEDNRICAECFELNKKKNSLIQISCSKQYSGCSSSNSSSRSNRTTFGRYSPQEDEGYATKVEKLLLEIANGDMTVDQAFGSGRPKVLHSPKC